MNFKIKAGRKKANNIFKMRVLPGHSLCFRFKLNISCLYNAEGIINGWNRVLGMRMMGANGSCDLLFTKDGKQFVVAMQAEYNSSTWNYKTTIHHRLGSVFANTWYHCEIDHYKNPQGKWFYNLFIESFPELIYPFSWQMTAPSSNIPFLMVRHPEICGRYTLMDDIELEIEIEN
jgi:hypothetical protein